LEETMIVQGEWEKKSHGREVVGKARRTLR